MAERAGVSECIQHSHYIEEDYQEERNERTCVVLPAGSFVPHHNPSRCCAAVDGMDVRAILLTGVPTESNDGSLAPSASSEEMFAGVPLALIPVLGQSVLHRLAARLAGSGIDSISVINAADPSIPFVAEACWGGLRWKNVSPDQIWSAAEEEFNHAAQAGAELVLVIRVGAYAELAIDPLLQFHLDQRNHTTQAAGPDGPLDLFVLSGSRRNDATFLFRNRLQSMRVGTSPYITTDYINRLCTSSDLRQLVLDSFALKTSIEPVGEQVRPGIWIAKGARVERGVRLVAPCYIGESARVRAGSLITRGSSLEHHSVVDCGSVVEGSTLLPFSYLGTGLDLMHSVVGLKRIASVKYSSELEVEDGTLVSSVSAAPAMRTLSQTIDLLACVPRQIIRSFLGRPRLRPLQIDPERPPANFDPAAVTKPAIPDRQKLAPGVLPKMREYGNQ
jgi:hypothetical protein